MPEDTWHLLDLRFTWCGWRQGILWPSAVCMGAALWLSEVFNRRIGGSVAAASLGFHPLYLWGVSWKRV
eukprot:scaffold33921_cov36-Tisochrysis_lutea.AAC.1